MLRKAATIVAIAAILGSCSGRQPEPGLRETDTAAGEATAPETPGTDVLKPADALAAETVEPGPAEDAPEETAQPETPEPEAEEPAETPAPEATEPEPAGEAPQKPGGPTVYHRMSFDGGMEGFEASGAAKVSLTDDAANGKALLCVCEGKWAGPALAFDIAGSKGLKMAFLAKGKNFGRASLNVSDRRAGDNTTSYAPRMLPDGEWTPVVYYLDRFRYNSSNEGYVAEETAYSGVRFFGPDPTGETTLTLDNFVIYRGDDTDAPSAVTGLKATVTAEGIELTWDPARDNVGVMEYEIDRMGEGEDGSAFGTGIYDSKKYAATCRTRFIDTTARRGNTYTYMVRACDFENNLGPSRLFVKATSALAVPVQKPAERTREELDRAVYAVKVREVHERGRGKVRKGHVCFYGDSLTHATSYPQAGQAALGIFTVAAHGFSGQTTSYAKDHVEEILDRENPEFLCVIFGTNDLRIGMPSDEQLKQWLDNMQTVAEAGQKRGTVVMFGTVPPKGFTDPDSKPEARYNEALAERAQSIGVPVAYVFQEIQAAGDRRNYISGDGIHWTGAGMEKAGIAWGKTMKHVQWVLRDGP
ncbi:MAG: SGNH/GDSL hydrolase family protein [Planctomycetes bacterium]|nr:SGNH/GDSL hydrolase family protein [Planctomycetota bacterium]